MGALAWRRVLTVSRGCTETVEALIAAAPAAAWPANTLSPSGLPPPTIAAAWKWRKAATPRFRPRGCGGGLEEKAAARGCDSSPHKRQAHAPSCSWDEWQLAH